MSSPQDRQRAFEAAVFAELGVGSRVRVSRAYGVSNSAKVVENGLQLAVLNLDTPSGDTAAWVVFTLLRFAPQDEVLIALVVRDELFAVDERVAAMKRAGAGDRGGLRSEDDLDYSARANNTVVYLNGDGRLVLRNRGFWDVLPRSGEVFGPTAAVDGAFVAITHATVGLAGVVEFVSWLRAMLPGVPLQPLNQGQAGVRPPALPGEVRQRFEAGGGLDFDGGLERLHLALLAMRPGGLAWLHGPPIAACADLAARHARAVGRHPRRLGAGCDLAADADAYFVVDGHDEGELRRVRQEALRRVVAGDRGSPPIVVVGGEHRPPDTLSTMVAAVFWRLPLAETVARRLQLAPGEAEALVETFPQGLSSDDFQRFSLARHPSSSASS